MMLLCTLVLRFIDLLEEVNRNYMQNKVSELSVTEVIFLSLDTILDVIVVLAVGILSIYHIIYLFSNTTTIDSWEKDRVQSMARRLKLPKVCKSISILSYQKLGTISLRHWHLQKYMRGFG